VGEERSAPSRAPQFELLRGAPELTAERMRLGPWLAAPPDKVLAIVARMDDPADLAVDGRSTGYACPMHPDVTSVEPGRCPACGMKLLPHHAPSPVTDGHEVVTRHHGSTADGIEWEDTMAHVNRLTTPATMHWSFVDRTVGVDLPVGDWRFQAGDRVKIRLVNDLDSDHPMHHPFHVHGAGRFLVLARDGVTEPNLVWKDTVLIRIGQVVDILFDVTNPGLWMAHCHIPEHMHSGMMFSFTVSPAA
jgi:FtsP/CotA-like multicopper oxidase with cupredoxin domain